MMNNKACGDGEAVVAFYHSHSKTIGTSGLDGGAGDARVAGNAQIAVSTGHSNNQIANAWETPTNFKFDFVYPTAGVRVLDVTFSISGGWVNNKANKVSVTLPKNTTLSSLPCSSKNSKNAGSIREAIRKSFSDRK